MTLHNLQEDLVKEKKIFTEKQLRILVIRTSLMLMLYGGTVGLFVFSVFGVSASLLILILFSLLFLWLFDSCSEDNQFAIGMYKFMRLWFTGIPVFIGTYIALMMFNII